MEAIVFMQYFQGAQPCRTQTVDRLEYFKNWRREVLQDEKKGREIKNLRQKITGEMRAGHTWPIGSLRR
jgi:hypothetical protein